MQSDISHLLVVSVVIDMDMSLLIKMNLLHYFCLIVKMISTKLTLIRKFVVVFILLSVQAGMALADVNEDLQKGLQAYQQRDYSTALSYLRPLAENGVAEAQRKLAVMYRHGRGVKQNDVEAIKWYRKAAEQGHVRAQNSLGIMYRFGLGVGKDSQEAAKWLTAAAEQGDSKGQENIAMMFLDGDGVIQSDEQAVYWLTKAARQGQMKSQLTLGLMTLAGRGIKKDEQQGMDWIMQSANQGYPQAAEAVAKAYADGLYGVEKDLQQAQYWYKRAGKKFQ